MNAYEIKQLDIEFGIINNDEVNNHSRNSLYPRVRDEVQRRRNIARSMVSPDYMKPNGQVDYPKFRDSLWDMAPTTDKFMVAKEHNGDYHDNFDTLSFFKWCVSLELTYPIWSKEKQSELEDHRRGVNRKAYFKDDEKDFWIIDERGNGRPARELIMILDDAPYHHGLNCQLNNKSKGFSVIMISLKFRLTGGKLRITLRFHHRRGNGQ